MQARGNKPQVGFGFRVLGMLGWGVRGEHQVGRGIVSHRWWAGGTTTEVKLCKPGATSHRWV